MPSAAFLAAATAATAANRQPVALVAIESDNAINTYVTTQSDWEASSPLTDINTSYSSGDIRLGTDGDEIVPGYYTAPAVASSVATDGSFVFYQDLGGGYTNYISYSSTFFTGTRSTVLSVRFTPNVGSVVWGAIVQGKYAGGSTWLNIAQASYSGAIQTRTLTSGQFPRGDWEFRIAMVYPTTGGTPSGPAITLVDYTETYETCFMSTGTLTTAATGLDLGLIPTVSSQLQTTDAIPPGCSITYTAWGRDTTGASWTALGTVADGASLDPYRYYQIKVDLTAAEETVTLSGGWNGYPYTVYRISPTVSEIRIIGGDSQYTYLSTHPDTPLHGALPWIAPGGVSSISSKIDLLQQATIGELTLKLFWRPPLGELLHSGYLKNKTIICKIGFLGLAEVDYEPYFVGTWFDYSTDSSSGIITVKTRNILRRFTKKIPDAAAFMDVKYFHIAFGTNNSGSGFTHNPSGKSYIGTLFNAAEADSSTPGDYTWSVMPTTSGSTVSAALNGQTNYVHIAYATALDGSTGFDLSSQSGKTYVGVYVDATAADSTDPVMYSWQALGAATNLKCTEYAKPSSPITVTYSGNIMDVMLSLADAMGIPDRLIDRGSFTDLAAGDRSSSDWDVARTISEPQDAQTLLNELSVSGGLFLFEGADGRLTVKLYDAFVAATPANTLDAQHVTIKTVDGGQKDLFTRQAIYNTIKAGKTGTSSTDFDRCRLKINVDAEINWQETATKEWFDKWDLSPAAIDLIAERWNNWFSAPHATIKAENVPPRFWGIERGDVVAVRNLQLPCPAADWPGYSNDTRFLVMGKTTSDPTTGNLTVSFDLMQLEAAVFSSTIL